MSEGEGHFDSVFSRQVDRVYRLCMLYLRCPADAEDVTQTVFLKYLRVEKVFESLEHEKAWFFRVAHNACRDVLKSAWRRKEKPVAQVREGIAPAQEEDVLSLMWQLPEAYRLVLYLHYFEGYQTREIGRMLHRNHSTVRTQLARARELMKMEMEGEDMDA